jgi:hypothetical protein
MVSESRSADVLFPLTLEIWPLSLGRHNANQKPYLLQNITASLQPKAASSALNLNDACDPYLQPGTLNLNMADIHDVYWTSFNPQCRRAPHFMADVLERKPLPWLQGRTVLLVGDSVDRSNLVNFCQLVNSSDVRMTMNHDLSDTIAPERSEANFSKTRICRVEEYDFEIINYFFWGMDVNDRDEDFTPEGPLVSYFEAVEKMFKNSTRRPDIISLSSGIPEKSGLAEFRALGSLKVDRT